MTYDSTPLCNALHPGWACDIFQHREKSLCAACECMGLETSFVFLYMQELAWTVYGFVRWDDRWNPITTVVCFSSFRRDQCLLGNFRTDLRRSGGILRGETDERA